MATTITKTIKPSGGDYTSLSAWEAGEQGDLTGVRDEISVAECYAMEDTSQAIFTGWTCDATRYIKIIVPSSERHDGKWNASKYRLSVASAQALQLDEYYMQVIGLQVSSGGATGYSAIYANHADNYQIDQCIFKITDTTQFLFQDTAAHSGAGAFIRNSIFYGSVRWGLYLNSSGTLTIQNCTVARNGRDGIYRLAGTVVATNVASIYNGDGSTYLDFQGTITKTYCASADASADDGGGDGNKINQTPSFVDEANRDYHLQSGDSALKDAGIDLSGSFSYDIDGQTRSGSWDIGADEYVAEGGVDLNIWASECVGAYGYAR